MERRKDTELRGERLPREYLDIISSVFTKNFSPRLRGRGKEREAFVVFGEIYPDEVLVAISLKNPGNLRMTTCYASMDYPPASLMGESGSSQLMAKSTSEAVQMTVNTCVDVLGSFFQSFFDEDRPIDFETDRGTDWGAVEIDKTTKVYVRINRDNLELEAASDEFIAQHEAMEDRAMQVLGDDLAPQDGEMLEEPEADDADIEDNDDQDVSGDFLEESDDEVEDEEPSDEDEDEDEDEDYEEPLAKKEPEKKTTGPGVSKDSPSQAKAKKRTLN